VRGGEGIPHNPLRGRKGLSVHSNEDEIPPLVGRGKGEGSGRKKGRASLLAEGGGGKKGEKKVYSYR